MLKKKKMNVSICSENSEAFADTERSTLQSMTLSLKNCINTA